jgi:hypothetical protein
MMIDGFLIVVYYESIKRELKIKPIYGCLETKASKQKNWKRRKKTKKYSLLQINNQDTQDVIRAWRIRFEHLRLPVHQRHFE